MRRGQWAGPFAGTNSGDMIVELDEIAGRLDGHATVYPSNPNLPPAFVPVSIPVGLTSHDTQLNILPIDVRSGEAVAWPQIANVFPAGTVIPASAHTKWRLSGDGTLYVSWTTDTKTFGLGVLSQSKVAPRPVGR